MKLAKIMLALSLALACGRALAAPTVDPQMQPYASPGALAKLADGRVIHLKCMGAGSPTVILTAGLGNWSEIWRKVQPSVATKTRVCAWDRAGFGFSDGALQTQTIANTTSDLEAALKSVGVVGPYVMVGHSLGGYESLLFADRHPDAVVGMVLVDSTIPDQLARIRKASPSLATALETVYRTGAAELRLCAAAVKSREIKVGSPDPQGCLDYPSTYPKETAAALSKLDMDGTRWAARLSLIEELEQNARLAVNPARTYGAMPLIVLTAERPQTPPKAVAEEYLKGYPAFLAEWTRAHDEMAALSTRGRNQLVSDSSHYIQIERPDVVIDAINDVVTQTREVSRAN